MLSRKTLAGCCAAQHAHRPGGVFMMIHDELIPQYKLERCNNCSGYGTKGYAKITCPTCKGTGSVKIPLVPKEIIVKSSKKEVRSD